MPKVETTNRIRIDRVVEVDSEEYKVWMYLKNLYGRGAAEILILAAVHLYRIRLYDDPSKLEKVRRESYAFFLSLLPELGAIALNQARDSSFEQIPKLAQVEHHVDEFDF